jgi:tetratricopeptide (TPR) repeat protein
VEAQRIRKPWAVNLLLARADDADGSLPPSLLHPGYAVASGDIPGLEKKPADMKRCLLAAGAERQKKYARALEAYDKIVAIDPAQGDAWFGQTRLLLTVVEDPRRGVEALGKALGAGFKDAKAVKALLESPGLLVRDKVEAALKERGLLPEQQPAEPVAAPAVVPDTKPAPSP